MTHRLPTTQAHRRALLAGLLFAPLGAALKPVHAWVSVEARSLAFYHTHTAEQLTVTYFADGVYVPESLAQIDRLLRDFRTGEVHSIDVGLLDTLHALTGVCAGGTFEVISGYRSAATNALLQKSGAGVAANSLHLQGCAIDVRLTGCETASLRAAALALARGGVGYYPASDFVHLDTGRVRSWT